jgi:hypothetical protein
MNGIADRLRDDLFAIISTEGMDRDISDELVALVEAVEHRMRVLGRYGAIYCTESDIADADKREIVALAALKNKVET